jgi:hypothetical protein
MLLRMRGPAAGTKKFVLQKSNFANGFNADSTVQSCSEKYLPSVFRKYMLVCRVPPRQGAYALSSRHVRRDVMDALVPARDLCADD